MPGRQRAWGWPPPHQAQEQGSRLAVRTHLCLLLDVLGCLRWGQLWGATNTMALEPRPSAPGLGQTTNTRFLV